MDTVSTLEPVGPAPDTRPLPPIGPCWHCGGHKATEYFDSICCPDCLVARVGPIADKRARREAWNGRPGTIEIKPMTKAMASSDSVLGQLERAALEYALWPEPKRRLAEEFIRALRAYDGAVARATTALVAGASA
jgi:hypothetical protein